MPIQPSIRVSSTATHSRSSSGSQFPAGSKILGTTTVTEYKMTNGMFQRRKVRLCVRGDQQQEGVDVNASDLYSPVLKAPEVLLLTAIAAEHGAASNLRMRLSSSGTSCSSRSTLQTSLRTSLPRYSPPIAHASCLSKTLRRPWHSRTPRLVRGLGPHEGEGTSTSWRAIKSNQSVPSHQFKVPRRCLISWSSTQVKSRRPLRGVMD